jgi:hypothetical protein
VQLGPLVAKKGADSRILDQCVFELITFAVGIPSRVDKLRLDQVVQCPSDRGSVSLAHRDQKIDIEHPAQKRRHMNDLPDRRQTIQTGVKRGLQSRRDLDGRAEAEITPALATDLVSSSMNSGTPSVLTTNCANMAAGRSSGAMPRIIASVSRRLSLASGRVTIGDEFDHGARNSGRAVSRMKSR